MILLVILSKCLLKCLKMDQFDTYCYQLCNFLVRFSAVRLHYFKINTNSLSLSLSLPLCLLRSPPVLSVHCSSYFSSRFSFFFLRFCKWTAQMDCSFDYSTAICIFIVFIFLHYIDILLPVYSNLNTELHSVFRSFFQRSIWMILLLKKSKIKLKVLVSVLLVVSVFVASFSCPSL